MRKNKKITELVYKIVILVIQILILQEKCKRNTRETSVRLAQVKISASLYL